MKKSSEPIIDIRIADGVYVTENGGAETFENGRTFLIELRGKSAVFTAKTALGRRVLKVLDEGVVYNYGDGGRKRVVLEEGEERAIKTGGLYGLRKRVSQSVTVCLEVDDRFDPEQEWGVSLKAKSGAKKTAKKKPENRLKYVSWNKKDRAWDVKVPDFRDETRVDGRLGTYDRKRFPAIRESEGWTVENGGRVCAKSEAIEWRNKTVAEREEKRAEYDRNKRQAESEAKREELEAKYPGGYHRAAPEGTFLVDSEGYGMSAFRVPYRDPEGVEAFDDITYTAENVEQAFRDAQYLASIARITFESQDPSAREAAYDTIAEFEPQSQQ